MLDLYCTNLYQKKENPIDFLSFFPSSFIKKKVSNIEYFPGYRYQVLNSSITTTLFITIYPQH